MAVIEKTFPGDCDERGRIAFDIPAAVTAYCRAKFAGQRVDVEIRPRKAKRSDKQNRAFHAAITPWARELGYHVEELKDELLGLVPSLNEDATWVSAAAELARPLL